MIVLKHKLYFDNVTFLDPSNARQLRARPCSEDLLLLKAKPRTQVTFWSLL